MCEPEMAQSIGITLTHFISLDSLVSERKL